VTHQAGRNSDPEKLARYAKERLTKWATDDVVTETADEHPDGWIIDRLAEIGDNETALETIEETLTRKLGGESATSLLTVQIKTESDGDYQWPGDIDVFREAMRQRKLSKLVTKNKAKDSSGDATDLVTGRPARTVGTSEDPQNYFLGKQLEKFPGLDIENAWRSHPISGGRRDHGDERRDVRRSLYLSNLRRESVLSTIRVWSADPETVYQLYGLLYRVVEDGGDTTPIEQAHIDQREQDLADQRFRFYVSAVMPHQMSRYDVFGETLNGRLHYPKELAFTHNRFVETVSVFNTSTEWTAPLPTNEKWGYSPGAMSSSTLSQLAGTFIRRSPSATMTLRTPTIHGSRRSSAC